MKKIIYITKYFLPIIFIVFYLETTMFMHSHVIDSQVIFHSHPYSSSQGQHTHSSADLLTIAQMGIVASFATFTFAAVSAAMILKAVLVIIKKCYYSFTIITLPQLRGPPVL